MPTRKPDTPGSRRAGVSLDRRRCLLALAAPCLMLPAGVGSAAPAPPASLWLTLFAGPSGGPVYWLTRGTEFVVVDGMATAVKGRISVIAAIARPRDGGTTRVSYLLQGVNATPTGFELAARLVHPITGDDIPTAVGAPLKLGWNLESGGALTEALVAANGTRATYRGQTWESPGSGGERTATLQMNIRLDRPSGAVETFAEISRSRARPLAAGDRAAPVTEFIAAESETFTVHELLEKAKYRGATVLSTSMNRGASYRGLDDLRSAMRPAESAALEAFFEQVAGWVKDA